jgi:SOS-response transcriptional repressor LexA
MVHNHLSCKGLFAIFFLCGYAVDVDMRWPKAITKARELRGLTQKVVGERLDVAHVAIGARERGTTGITDEWLAKFLAAIEMSRVEFDLLVSKVPVQSITPSREIPLYPNLASAGQRAFAPEDTGEDWTEMVDRGNSTTHPQAFAVKVHGDSMAPMILHGDTLVCEPLEDDDGWNKLADGRIVAVWGGVTSTTDFERVDGELKPVGKQVRVPEGGMLGKWMWADDRAAELHKLNERYKSVALPSQHDGTMRVALVVQIRRNV